MPSVATQRCLNHPSREAVARCPECRSFFCRECITEHAGRVLCANCLRTLSAPRKKRKLRLGGVLVAGRCVVSFVAAWMFFYLIARALVAIPSSFHETALWSVLDPASVAEDGK